MAAKRSNLMGRQSKSLGTGRRRRRFVLAAAAAFGLHAGARHQSASATPLWWDVNGAAANAGASGTGLWDGAPANPNWNTASSGTGGTLQAGTGSGDDLTFS